jgi:hypothetical protein
MNQILEDNSSGTLSATSAEVAREGELVREVGRRRTFAIISRSDAGKTTHKILPWSPRDFRLAGDLETAPHLGDAIHL